MTKQFLSVLLSVTALCATSAAADSVEYRDLRVEVRGEGRPVLMIPGLNSAASTWKETCGAIQPAECHMVHLPGFAGREPVDGDRFLEAMRDRLVAYARDRELADPVLVGHSLGGVLSLMIALDAPDVPERLVVVDALPFLPAARNPSATVEGMQPAAENMRRQMLEAPDDQYRARMQGNMKTMSVSTERVREVEAWGESSARGTTAQAMYELMTTDLRDAIAGIRQPTLVLGSWAAYASAGATKEGVTQTYRSQYAKLEDFELRMSEDGYHFLMWDDPELVVSAIRESLDK